MSARSDSFQNRLGIARLDIPDVELQERAAVVLISLECIQDVNPVRELINPVTLAEGDRIIGDQAIRHCQLEMTVVSANGTAAADSQVPGYKIGLRVANACWLQPVQVS